MQQSPSPMSSEQPFQFLPTRHRSTGNIVLTYGLIFGALLVIIDLISVGIGRVLFHLWLNAEYSADVTSITYLVPPIIFTLTYWVIYFFAGFLTARKTRSTAIAAQTGLLATLCFFVIFCITIIINIVSAWSILSQGSGILQYYLLSLVRGVLIVIVAQMGLGIGISALGGLVGKETRNQPAPREAELRSHQYHRR